MSTKTNEITLPKIIAAGIALLLIAASVFWLYPRRPTLIGLQKEYLLARPDSTAQDKVIDRLIDYYLTMDIPDSISQRVEREVQAEIHTTEIDLADYTDEIFDEPNPYRLENTLKALLRTAMIAKAGEKERIFGKLMQRAMKMAQMVDEGTEHGYWVEFVGQVEGHSLEQSLAWLHAHRALAICRSIIDSNHVASERYACLGLQRLKQVPDERIGLDLTQRLQYILYSCWNLFDISIALADRNSVRSDRSNDIIRQLAISYHKAVVLSRNGQIINALALFQEVQQDAKSHQEIPFISWFVTNTLIETALCYWQLGQFEKTLAACRRLDGLQLPPADKLRVHNTKGLVFKRVGKFEQAAIEYRRALYLAERNNDVSNEIRFLNNLGNLYFELTEYDRAIEYLTQANDKLLQYRPEDFEMQINLAIDMANVMVKKNRYGKVDSLISRAMNLLSQLGDFPWSKADLLATLATFNQQQGKAGDALLALQEAERICERNGLYGFGLVYKVRIAESHVLNNKFNDARRGISEALAQAIDLGYVEIEIEGLALLAEIEHREGNFPNALMRSNQVVQRISEITSRFQDRRTLIPFQQKVYGYLKANVLHEIQTNHRDSAFVKLAAAKAVSFGAQRNATNANISAADKISRLQALLDSKTVILDYLVAEDSLYVFRLDHQALSLYRKGLNMGALEENVARYTRAIRDTKDLFNNYQVDETSKHFESTLQLSRRLYEDLLGWVLAGGEDGQAKVYVIPDEFLYELPFATLVQNVSNKWEFLAENHSVVFGNSSLAFLADEQRVAPQNSTPSKVFISVDVNIPGAREFLTFLMSRFPQAQVLSSPKNIIEKSDVLAQFEQHYDIMIILGHGEANTIFPEQSYIEVSVLKENKETENIQITLADLKSDSWQGAEMVLLIGCETGEGKGYRGSGILGLQQGFLRLGVKHVLANLWRIDAANTIAQMTEFVRTWQDSADPVATLGHVQRVSIDNLIKHEVYGDPHPYFWGGHAIYSTVIQ